MRGVCAVNSLVLPGSHLTDTLQLSVAINMAIANMCLVLLLGSPVFHSQKISLNRGLGPGLVGDEGWGERAEGG